jgi:hypothetical protein
MLPRLAAAAGLVLASLSAQAQSTDPNLQILLNSLTSGNAVTLVTPLADGRLQVTRFAPGVRMSAIEAAGAIDRARSQLQALGEPAPTAEETARALAGGPISLPTGRIHALGILPASGYGAAIQSQVVAAGTPLPAGAYASVSAAAGGSAPLAEREQALQQLAALGILNPSEDQVRAALIGGPITTLNGVYELPGILPK